MAYVDYDFYVNSYFGSVVPESEFNRTAERASDFVDALTSYVLEKGLPTNEAQLKRLKKAICVLTDKIYEISLAEKNANNMASAETSKVTGSGISTGMVTSVSSGSESVSYATPQQIGSGAKEWSKLYDAVGDPQKTNSLLVKTILPLLMGINTDEGVPILYVGL